MTPFERWRAGLRRRLPRFENALGTCVVCGGGATHPEHLGEAIWCVCLTCATRWPSRIQSFPDLVLTEQTDAEYCAAFERLSALDMLEPVDFLQPTPRGASRMSRTPTTSAPESAPFDIRQLDPHIFGRMGDADRQAAGRYILDSLHRRGWDPSRPELSASEVFNDVRDRSLPSGKTVDQALRSMPTGAAGEIREAVKVLVTAARRRAELLEQLRVVDQVGDIPIHPRPAPRNAHVPDNAVIDWGGAQR